MAEGTGVILLHKEKFDYYSAQFGRAIEFKFIPEIVRDFDVVNAELLENLIKLFVESNKIPKTELMIVIADNASFVKDILPTTVPGQTLNIQDEINKFIESVPFDEVASVTFPMTQGTKVWASNKGLFGVLTSAFEKNGYKVSTVLPGLLFGPDIGNKPMLDPVTANLILQKTDAVKADHNLLSQKQNAPVVEEKVNAPAEGASVNVDIEAEPPKKTDKKRLFIMLGVFVVLIIVLIIVYISSMNQQY